MIKEPEHLIYDTSLLKPQSKYSVDTSNSDSTDECSPVYTVNRMFKQDDDEIDGLHIIIEMESLENKSLNGQSETMTWSKGDKVATRHDTKLTIQNICSKHAKSRSRNTVVKY